MHDLRSILSIIKTHLNIYKYNLENSIFYIEKEIEQDYSYIEEMHILVDLLKEFNIEFQIINNSSIMLIVQKR